MRDLSVIDVQNFLREHARHGHDVTQHPHISVIAGKDYRMRATAELTVDGYGGVLRNKLLASDLMQSERPMLTHINSWNVNPSHSSRPPELTVHGLVPYRMTHDGKSDDYFLLASPGPHGKYSDMFQHYEKPTGDGSYNPKIHEILQNHVTEPLDFVGLETVRGKEDWEQTVHKNLSDFSPKFDTAKALNPRQGTVYGDIAPQPFSGLVHVMYHTGTRADDSYRFDYHYDPAKETLVRVH